MMWCATKQETLRVSQRGRLLAGLMGVRLALAVVALAAMCAVGSNAAMAAGDPETLEFVLDLPANSLQIFEADDGQHVRMDGASSLGVVGQPDLLVSPQNVILPPERAIAQLEVLQETWRKFPGVYQIAPTQAPQLTDGTSDLAQTQPDPQVYGSAAYYPTWTVRLVGHGNMRGAQVARLEVAPLRWIPASGHLEVLSQVKVRVQLAAVADESVKPAPNSAQGLVREIEYVQRNVSNPQDVVGWLSLGTGDRRAEHHYEPKGEPPVYVIIAPSGAMADECKRLASWLTMTGLPADVVEVKWILSSYGLTSHYEMDRPELVREFLVDAYEHYGIQYVLLAGDYDEVPTRDFRSSYSPSPPGWWDPTDFYYSDLTLNHNLDGDNYWFERYEDYPADFVLFEDVYVGRIPAKNAQMIADYLDKWFSYVLAEENDYQRRILYAGDDVYGCSSTVNKYESQIDPIVNMPPYSVTKLYCDEWPEIPEWSPLTIMNFIECVSAGENLILHSAHSGYSGMGMGDGSFRNGIYGVDHVEMLTNLDRYGVMYSLGCHVQPWDYDHAIGEDLVMDPGRGLVASLANSDVGWWPTQFTGIQAVTESIYGDDVTPIAQNMIDAKQFSIWWYNSRPSDPYEPYYTPWGKCSVNLLGEPSMQVWTASPSNLGISGEAKCVDDDTWVVVITAVNLSAPFKPSPPVVGAKVCLSGAGIYEIGVTGKGGRVEFKVAHPKALVLKAAATAHNFVPGLCKVLLPTPWEEWGEHP